MPRNTHTLAGEGPRHESLIAIAQRRTPPYPSALGRYFSMTKDILRKHSHVSSFGAIQTECEDTMRRLQDKLQKELDNPVSRLCPPIKHRVIVCFVVVVVFLCEGGNW